MDEDFKQFVREYFRELKVKNATRLRMGRLTYEWVLGQENKDRLDHLTLEKLEALAERHQLKKVTFDDGNTYIVAPDKEHEILEAFLQKKEMLEPRILNPQIRGDAPYNDEDLSDRHLISSDAVLVLTGAEPDPDSSEAVAFESNVEIEKALDDNRLRITYDEGKILVFAADEEPEDSIIFPLHLRLPLAGTEISVEELDIGRRTLITADYRDTVGEASHDFEHLVTKMED